MVSPPTRESKDQLALKIGLLDSSSPQWTAGGTYTRTVLAAVASAEGLQEHDVFFLRADPSTPVPGGITALDMGDRPDPKTWLAGNHLVGIDVVLPWRERLPPSGYAAVGWIPDFQHLHLPSLFSTDEIALREEVFRNIARFCQRVMISSHCSAEDFGNLFPEHASKVRVLPFPSLLAAEGVPETLGDTLEKYRLPGIFGLISNQFWAHKNHSLIAPALARLKERGISIPLVVTGLPADYRDPANKTVTSFLQSIAAEGVRNDVYFLASVTRQELIDLLRACSFVLQPSLSEGWNTTIQDAKALGKRVVCSDLPVHREQCGSEASYFDPASADSLAGALHSVVGRLSSAVDMTKEKESLARASVEMQKWGSDLLKTAREAAEAHRSSRSKSSGFLRALGDLLRRGSKGFDQFAS